METKKEKIQVGQIGAPHGVRGEVRVAQVIEFADKIVKLDKLLVEGVDWLEIESARFHKQFILLKFAGIDNMDQADRLKNKKVFALREQLGDLPAGRYYISDIIGLQVFDLQGNFLGDLSEVLQTGSNDVYVITHKDKKDVLLPALKTVIKETDLENGKMIVDPPIWEDDN